MQRKFEQWQENSGQGANQQRSTDARFCPRCGQVVTPDDLFCAHCGYALKAATTPDPEATRQFTIHSGDAANQASSAEQAPLSRSQRTGQTKTTTEVHVQPTKRRQHQGHFFSKVKQVFSKLHLPKLAHLGFTGWLMVIAAIISLLGVYGHGFIQSQGTASLAHLLLASGGQQLGSNFVVSATLLKLVGQLLILLPIVIAIFSLTNSKLLRNLAYRFAGLNLILLVLASALFASQLFASAGSSLAAGTGTQLLSRALIFLLIGDIALLVVSAKRRFKKQTVFGQQR
ncbi:zinc ribbon domain-containing protein [Lapidilactobacillus wuchangensis]|uniref:zinc ribbon domain-containing protein n=1 Tax=Lapidilactobacillus wuchangensis TaxID=2486001 RepID=UPI000F76C04D|nr:zinc ribbon domain-containing protein [Lapidilactobacillus wuchangensis]